MWLILVETWGEHLLLHSKGLLDTQNYRGSLPMASNTISPTCGALKSPVIWDLKMIEMTNHSSPELTGQSHSRGKKTSPVIYTFKWVWGARMRAQEKSLRKCRQLTVTASLAFLSKDVTCSEPGTVRSCRMSLPADWWKWLTLGCQLKNQLFTSTR